MWWNKYADKKFEIKGRGPDTFDCWGLLQWIYAHDRYFLNEDGEKVAARVILPGYEEFYEDTKDRETLSQVIFEQRQERWREVTKPQQFDAILLRMRGVPMHVGVVTKPGHMIHCAHGVGTSHERFDSMRWREKGLGFFRYE